MFTASGCQGFCSGGKETPEGMIATGFFNTVKENGKSVKLFAKVQETSDGKPLCPLGFSHNPTSEKSTMNAIRNGGRLSICQKNPWKWHRPK